jgi:uncharacterized protein (TIGR03067 family)
MRLLVIVPTLAIPFVAGAGGAQDDLKKEMARLEGEWSMVSGEANGFAMPKEMLKSGKRVAQDGETTISFGAQVYFRAKYTLDPTKKPRAIDYQMTEGPTKGKTHLGIYELDGDTLRLCFAAPGRERPTEFTAREGSQRTLSVWKRITRQDPGAGPVELDVPYAEGGDQHKLDLFLPPGKGFTSIVFTYGGGWHTGSRKSVKLIGEQLQRLGFGCALLSHRLGPKDKFPAQAEDVAAGFAWVKQNIQARGGHPKRVVVMGHSSGAHLSLLIATDPKYLARHYLAPADIAAVVGLSTPVDLEPRADRSGFGDALLAGKGAGVFTRDVAVMKGASPIQHVSRDLPPTLLIVGERDFPMLEKDAQRFAEKADKIGRPVRTFVAKGTDHMGVVRALLDERSAIRVQVLDFLKKVEDGTK